MCEGFFFGVGKGLLPSWGSLELTSDLDESEGRVESVAGKPCVPFPGPVADEDDTRGVGGSSNGARDGRRLSSMDSFRIGDLRGRTEEAP